jgi:hypothetical protein
MTIISTLSLIWGLHWEVHPVIPALQAFLHALTAGGSPGKRTSVVVGREGREIVCVGGLVRISRCSSLGSGFANVADKSEETRTMKILERIIINEDWHGLESFRKLDEVFQVLHTQVVK